MVRGGCGGGGQTAGGKAQVTASAVFGEWLGGRDRTSKGKKGEDERGKLGVGRQAPAPTSRKSA